MPPRNGNQSKINDSGKLQVSKGSPTAIQACLQTCPVASVAQGAWALKVLAAEAYPSVMASTHLRPDGAAAGAAAAAIAAAAGGP
eukprot:1151572-Pelagomonas_calceolata.AAC.1